MDKNLENQVAVITGAGTGIGKAIALELALRGANIAVCGRRLAPLEETAKEIQNLGRKVHVGQVDVTSNADVQTFIQNVTKEFGRIDILVNNAGVTKDNLLMRMTENEWDTVIDTNLKGAFLFSKAVSRTLMKQRSGSIINITSIVGIIGNAGQANYSASKAGLIALTKSMAKELAPRGIRVNAVAPGFIMSQMTEALSEELRQTMLSHIPLSRFGEASDVAKAVAYLSSPDSSYITGQTLSVNGGLAM